MPKTKSPDPRSELLQVNIIWLSCQRSREFFCLTGTSAIYPILLWILGFVGCMEKPMHEFQFLRELSQGSALRMTQALTSMTHVWNL